MPVFRFGLFQLDPARRELLRDGVPVAVPPRAFDLIVYLLEHRDRAVGRDELIAGAWGRVDVSDNVLDQTVLRARRALDDLAEPRHTIATRPRFGFAWVAAVEVLEAGDGELPAPADAAPASPPSVPVRPAAGRAADRGRRWPIAAIVALALLAVVLAVAPDIGMRWPGSSDASGSAPSDASHRDPVSADATLVLPFTVAAGAEADWTRLGLMDLVAQRLRDAGVHTLRSDNAVALLRGRDGVPDDADALAALARRAGAVRVVRGAVALAEGRWTVTLQSGNADARLTAEGHGSDPLDAARRAADQLATALGRRPSGVALPADAGLALRLQEIDALVLGDALPVARERLAALPADWRDEPAVRLRAATLQFRGGDLDRAGESFTALLADVSASDDPHLHGTLQSALGNLALRRGDPAEAERRGELAIAVLAGLAPSPELGRAYTGRAIARSTQGRYASALEDFAQARMVLDGVGDRIGVARVDINVGILDARRDRHADALPLLAAAADRLAAFNDLTNELFARVTLARSRLGMLEPAAALAVEARLAELVAREPNAERRRYANLARVEVLAANGRLAAARALLAAVGEDARADGDIVLLGVAQALAAQWALDDDPATAAREAQAALNAPWADEDERQFAATWRVLVRGRLAAGDLPGAAAALAGFDAWAAGQPDKVHAQHRLAQAELAAARQQHDDAEAAYAAALAAAEASRLPADLLEVVASYAPWLAARGDAGRATTVAGRSAGFADRHYGAAIALARLHRALGHAAAADSALAQARRLAGERRLPADLAAPGA